LIPTLQNKQTNKQTQLVSALKVPKGETKVWAIATATVPRDMKVKQAPSGAREALHPAWDQVILHASFHILIYKLVFELISK